MRSGHSLIIGIYKKREPTSSLFIYNELDFLIKSSSEYLQQGHQTQSLCLLRFHRRQ